MAVKKKLMEMFGSGMTNMKFAVRSSASGEDSEEMSAAGQMETFLGVGEIDEVLKTVVKCWASQFTFVATEYKRRNGQNLNLPMAVVIQEMVPSEVAGVMFTCDPVTTNPSFITITANYGLGETVVSASADPDTVILHRDYQNQLKPHSSTTGKKNVQIVMENDGGTKTIEVPEEKANQKCILDEWTIPLGKIGVEVESSFGSARDIEWALYQRDIYLLQARPITSLHAETDFEIMHELDGSLRSEKEYLTKANVGEVFPGAQSFLGATFISPIFQVVFRIIWNKREGKRIPKSVYATRGFVNSYNHLIFNMFDFMFRDVKKDGTLSNFSKAYIISMFGRLVDDPEILKMAGERNDPLPRIQSIKRIPFMLWVSPDISNVSRISKDTV
ncbi:uncharacterized protein LOC106475641, partial [Limulus polyphemus]|uniref:Uncharacterized protein LOC106475641 n=1 Tax=Limulus polyphemus TaxID=6850 RepID=A0ABM1RVK2_LIMPO